MYLKAHSFKLLTISAHHPTHPPVDGDTAGVKLDNAEQTHDFEGHIEKERKRERKRERESVRV
jgi:hypothetical protein